MQRKNNFLTTYELVYTLFSYSSYTLCIALVYEPEITYLKKTQKRTIFFTTFEVSL